MTEEVSEKVECVVALYTILGNDASIFVEDNKHWNSLDTELLTESIFLFSVIVRKCQPWHLAIVFFEASVIFVGRGKDDFKLFPRCQQLVVEGHEIGSKSAARWAPLKTE
jgi:hypothetical protein